MFDHDSIYKVLDSHFAAHLVRDYEDERAQGSSGETPPDAPESMLDDLIDELDEVLEDLHEQYGQAPKALNAIVFGFMDGVVAWSDGSYSTFEDEYIQDMGNVRFADLDAEIAAYTESFEGNRDWGEAALGYVRHVAVSLENAKVEGADALLLAQAIGFARGADTAEDYEWKVIQDSLGNIIVTDEDALDEFNFNRMNATGGGLLGKISNALEIDLSELESALGGADDEDGEDA